MAKDKKGKDTRPIPRGMVSIGRKKPYVSSGTTKSVTMVIPKDVLEDVGFERGDFVEVYRNVHNDLLIRFPLKEGK